MRFEGNMNVNKVLEYIKCVEFAHAQFHGDYEETRDLLRKIDISWFGQQNSISIYIVNGLFRFGYIEKHDWIGFVLRIHRELELHDAPETNTKKTFDRFGGYTCEVNYQHNITGYLHKWISVDGVPRTLVVNFCGLTIPDYDIAREHLLYAKDKFRNYYDRQKYELARTVIQREVVLYNEEKDRIVYVMNGNKGIISLVEVLDDQNTSSILKSFSNWFLGYRIKENTVMDKEAAMGIEYGIHDTENNSAPRNLRKKPANVRHLGIKVTADGLCNITQSDEEPFFGVDYHLCAGIKVDDVLEYLKSVEYAYACFEGPFDKTRDLLREIDISWFGKQYSICINITDGLKHLGHTDEHDWIGFVLRVHRELHDVPNKNNCKRNALIFDLGYKDVCFRVGLNVNGVERELEVNCPGMNIEYYDIIKEQLSFVKDDITIYSDYWDYAKGIIESESDCYIEEQDRIEYVLNGNKRVVCYEEDPNESSTISGNELQDDQEHADSNNPRSSKRSHNYCVRCGYQEHADSINDYCSEHTVKLHPLLQELREMTLAEAKLSTLLGSSEVLTLGANFIQLINGKKILDIGTYTGASALAWALAAEDDAQVFTLDVNHDNYNKFGVPVTSKCEKTFKKIVPISRPALEHLDKLIADGKSGTFDFGFIDADKVNYPNYYDRVLSLLRKGGVVLVYDSLWSGRVIGKIAPNDLCTRSVDATNKKIFNDDRTASMLLNYGKGIHMAFKK